MDRGLLGLSIIFQSDLDHALLVVVLKLVLQDITLVVQDLGHTLFQVGSRDLNDSVSCHLRITNSSQKICNRICYHILSSYIPPERNNWIILSDCLLFLVYCFWFIVFGY